MKLPEVREMLHNVADDPRMPPDLAKVIKYLADETKRRRHRSVEAVSVPMTADLARRIRAFAKANPGMAQFQIGQVFNVNQGRVSEALHGERV